MAHSVEAFIDIARGPIILAYFYRCMLSSCVMRMSAN